MKIITARLNDNDINMLEELKEKYKQYVSPYINIKDEPTTTAIIKWCILNTYCECNKKTGEN